MNKHASYPGKSHQDLLTKAATWLEEQYPVNPIHLSLISKTVRPVPSKSPPPPSRSSNTSPNQQQHQGKSTKPDTATLTERQKETRRQLERIRIEDQSRMQIDHERLELDSTTIAPLRLDSDSEEEEISDLQEVVASEQDSSNRKSRNEKEQQPLWSPRLISLPSPQKTEILLADVLAPSLYSNERRVSETTDITRVSQLTDRSPETNRLPLPKIGFDEPESDSRRSKAVSHIPGSLRAGPRPASQSSFADLDRIVRHGSRKEGLPPR
ncbi:MAG: hypothetical protein Q9174_001547 [Haloplaca sp. 1 TL-2023]